MPARIDERTQFVDAAGTPIVNGKIYIGVQNSDPVANPITIYSDRALTIPIANPQLTDSDGRSVNKIWIPGDYSLRVDNSLDVQQLLDLDSGVAIEATGVTPLSNTAGTNTITAEGTITMTPWGSNNVSTPDGGSSYGWYVNNKIYGGALVGKVGEGEVFKIGSQLSFTAANSGISSGQSTPFAESGSARALPMARTRAACCSAPDSRKNRARD